MCIILREEHTNKEFVMNRSLHTRYGLFAGGVVLTLGLFALATGAGQAQVVTKPKVPTQRLVKKQPYVTRPAQSTTDLNAAVRKFADSKRGQPVGNGECWDLVKEALQAAGAKLPGQGGYGTYEFGKVIPLKDVLPGDILQFENVAFKHRYPNGSWYEDKFEHHTAIVSRHLPEVQGKVLGLLHQNVNGNRTVQTGTINLDHKQSLDPSKASTLTAYRPQSR